MPADALPGKPPLPPQSSSVAGLVVRTLGWLPVAFAAWYLAAPLLLMPAALLVRATAHVMLGDLVRSVDQSSAVLTFVTMLKPGVAVAGGIVTVDVNLLAYAFGLPLFAALTLAARERAWKRHLVVGCVALMPCVAASAMADFLKNVAIAAGPVVASQAGFSTWQREAIAFAYQFGSLILPAVAPAVLWIAMHGRFLAALRR